MTVNVKIYKMPSAMLGGHFKMYNFALPITTDLIITDLVTSDFNYPIEELTFLLPFNRMISPL